MKGERFADAVRTEVAALVDDEAYRPYSRFLLPKEFTGGREVYSAHVWIARQYLPDGFLTLPFVRACALTGAQKSRPLMAVLMMPYDDYDEDPARRR